MKIQQYEDASFSNKCLLVEYLLTSFDVFRGGVFGYRKRPVTGNRFIVIKPTFPNFSCTNFNKT